MMPAVDFVAYKGYMARIRNDSDGVYWGKIMGIPDLVLFEGETLAEAQREFRKAVDDYIQFCKEVGKEPENAQP